MFFSERFICASKEKNEYEKQVNAPLFKREFDQVKANNMKISRMGLESLRIARYSIKVFYTRIKVVPRQSRPYMDVMFLYLGGIYEIF